MELNPIILSIPIYFLLIGIELLIQYLSKEKLYRLNDAITNISCGITQQITNVFLKVAVLALYELTYSQLALFTIEPSWWTYLILFILVDFCYYWAHRMSHEVNLFWGGHVVHHQSEDYNFSVALRQGSFQIIWTQLFFLPLAIIGFDTLSFVLILALNTVYQFWIHTEKIGKLGFLEKFMNTPSHHRVHHGRDPKYIDKNHAGVFIVWDKLFGTFQEEEEHPTYGITTPINSWNPVWANWQHYASLLKQIKGVRSGKDRLKTLFYKPGWRPNYLGGYQAPPPVEAATYQKFATPIPKALAAYVIVHYVVLLAGTALFLFQEAQFAWPVKILLVGLILFGVTSIGLLLEHRKRAGLIETIRLTLSMLCLLWLPALASISLLLKVVVACIILFGSLGWLWYFYRSLQPAKTHAIST